MASWGYLLVFFRVIKTNLKNTRPSPRAGGSFSASIIYFGDVSCLRLAGVTIEVTYRFMYRRSEAYVRDGFMRTLSPRDSFSHVNE
jgi:hypothetical protein